MQLSDEKAPPRSYLKQPISGSYRRPDGIVNWCMKSSWGEDPKLKQIERAAPDLWKHVRYRLENHLKLHHASSNRGCSTYITARIVNDFESRDLDSFPVLKDNDLVDEDSVIILYRHPSPRHIGHYVPLALLPEWEEWIALAEQNQRSQATKSKHQTFHARRRDFYTDSHAWGRKGWFPRHQGHPSLYAKRPPPHWRCKRCDAAGDHWTDHCNRKERTAKRLLRMIHGIPRSALQQVDPESELGREATLRDYEGNLYVQKDTYNNRKRAQEFLDNILASKKRRT